MNVGIIGCGLIGRKRALALDLEDSLVGCYDVDENAAIQFCEEFKCNKFSSPADLLANSNCEIIIIAVVNKFSQRITELSSKLGQHVLVEKPLGRNSIEAASMVRVAAFHGKLLKTGFNHRFHPAILKAKELVSNGSIGQLLFIRGRYGHGSRPGMEMEWRSSKDLCGGGELLDQGVHLIDLSRWFSGEIRTAFGKVKTKYWNIEVEDNAFLLLESEYNVDINLQVSWTNWKNIFSFELYGSDGYIKIEGLGGNYGSETLEFGKRKKEGGRPEIQLFDFPSEDLSWVGEWAEFKSAIKEGREPIGNGIDGLRANEVIDAIYQSSKTGKIITIN
jgi:predicted dehydrogenase